MQNKQLIVSELKLFVSMAIIDQSSDAHHRLFSPLWPCLEASPSQRQCQEYSDKDFLEVGVSRVLTACQSGRDLLQRLALMRDGTPGRSNFFESLKGKRRLKMVEDVAQRLRQKCAGGLPDVLAQFSELDEFDVYAGDGHSHEHASHDEPINGGKLCVTHLYTRNLRNGWMTHLDLCAVKEKGNHHDMAVLKSLPPAVLRQGAKRRRKVIYSYDRAAQNADQSDACLNGGKQPVGGFHQFERQGVARASQRAQSWRSRGLRTDTRASTAMANAPFTTVSSRMTITSVAMAIVIGVPLRLRGNYSPGGKNRGSRSD